MTHFLTILTVLFLVLLSGTLCAMISVPNEFAVLASMMIVVFTYEPFHGWFTNLLSKK